MEKIKSAATVVESSNEIPQNERPEENRDPHPETNDGVEVEADSEIGKKKHPDN